MKQRFKKALTITLCLVLSASIMSPALAAENDATQTSPVKLTAQPIVFNVTVPSGLPVDIDAQGEVTVATNVKIENHSAAPISITGIQVNPIIDWSIVPMNKDFKGTKIGTKEFGFVLNSDEVPTSGSVALTKANWPSINGGSNLPLIYNSVVAPQKDAINSNKIADVVFTIGWDAAESEVPVAPPEIGTKHIEGNYEYSYGQEYSSSWRNSSLSGWGVRIVDNTQTSYVQPVETIQGQPVVSYSNLFRNYPNTVLILEGTWTNKNVKDMYCMFSESAATNLDLSNFNTSNVTNMYQMFYQSKATEIKGLRSFNTSNVLYMSYMFAESQATSLDLSSFDTSKVTTMRDMFAFSQANSLDLSNFNTSNITDMQNMFDYSKATSLNLSNFDTSNVTNMRCMFKDTQATVLDLSSFNTSNVENVDWMFLDCKTTVGYARSETDVTKLNASEDKPSALTFVVK